MKYVPRRLSPEPGDPVWVQDCHYCGFTQVTGLKMWGVTTPEGFFYSNDVRVIVRTQLLPRY